MSEDEPLFDGADEVFETWRAFMSATGLGDEYDARGDDMKRDRERRGRARPGADLGQLTRATRLQAALAERALAFFDRYDYLACPVTQVEPFPIEQEYAAEIARCADGLLHRVDALQLAHQRDRLPGHLRPGRLQRRGPARRPPAGDAAVRRAGAARGRARARAAHRVSPPHSAARGG